MKTDSEKLEGEIDELKEQIYANVKRNSLLPVSSLPLEILLNIFQRVVGKPSVRTSLLDYYSTYGYTLDLSHVCHHWRIVTINEAPFWATFSNQWGISQHLLDLLLSRSGQTPLYVYVHERELDEQTGLDIYTKAMLVPQVVRRISTLHLQCSPQMDGASIIKFLSQVEYPMHLKHLEIHGSWGFFIPAILKNEGSPLLASVKFLRKLVIEAQHVQAHASVINLQLPSSIEHLEIITGPIDSLPPSHKPTPAQLLTALKPMRSLKVLKLSDFILEPFGISQDLGFCSERVEFPCLRWLEISGLGLFHLQFVGSLQLPSIESISLYFYHFDCAELEGEGHSRERSIQDSLLPVLHDITWSPSSGGAVFLEASNSLYRSRHNLRLWRRYPSVATLFVTTKIHRQDFLSSPDVNIAFNLEHNTPTMTCPPLGNLLSSSDFPFLSHATLFIIDLGNLNNPFLTTSASHMTSLRYMWLMNGWFVKGLAVFFEQEDKHLFPYLETIFFEEVTFRDGSLPTLTAVLRERNKAGLAQPKLLFSSCHFDD
jgi:hypothetical protein